MHKNMTVPICPFLKVKPGTADIANIYSRVMWVISNPAKNEHGEDGIWSELGN
jgi:hypothetical protein